MFYHMRNMAALLRLGGYMSHSVKPFKTVEEQIALLTDRGLIVDDIEAAKNIFLTFNYYRISAYTLTLRNNDIFYQDVHLNDVMQIYNFDMELRASLLYILEYIEISIRTHIGYYHAKSYGPLGYLNSNSFSDLERFLKFKSDYETTTVEYGSKEAFVKHYKDVYEGQFPIWALVELLSFGSLSRLFKNLKTETQDEICKAHYGRIGKDYIENWLQGFTILRNICAHRGRLYNREIPFGLKLQSRDKKLFYRNELLANKAPKQLFSYIFVSKKLIIEPVAWKTFADRFLLLINKYPFVKISNYGFYSGSVVKT